MTRRLDELPLWRAMVLLEDEGLVGRHMNGKRTYAVFLAGHAPTSDHHGAPATSGEAKVGTERAMVARGDRPPASDVTVTRMSLGDQIDLAVEACGDHPLVRGAFTRAEDVIAGHVDEIAMLRQLVIDSHQLLPRYVAHVTFLRGPGLSDEDRDRSPVEFTDREWQRLQALGAGLSIPV